MLPIDTSTYSFDPLFINAVVGWAVNSAKHSDNPLFRWIDDATPWITRSVHALIAAFSAAGMTISYATADDGSMSITLAGITLAGISSFLFTAGKNYLAQAGTSGAIDVFRWMKEFGPVLIDLKQQLDKQKGT